MLFAGGLSLGTAGGMNCRQSRNAVALFGSASSTTDRAGFEHPGIEFGWMEYISTTFLEHLPSFLVFSPHI
ncbi:hypothetical protein RIF29_06268 [Crotalaria pallida]|uniref:Uncharacterized protein n=1 Tax=Crotalaria pallida TaxID=3830 RepID=A0AAN9J432_CROPI